MFLFTGSKWKKNNTVKEINSLIYLGIYTTPSGVYLHFFLDWNFI